MTALDLKEVLLRIDIGVQWAVVLLSVIACCAIIRTFFKR